MEIRLSDHKLGGREGSRKGGSDVVRKGRTGAEGGREGRGEI
jgi:hypothetical protein